MKAESKQSRGKGRIIAEGGGSLGTLGSWSFWDCGARLASMMFDWFSTVVKHPLFPWFLPLAFFPPLCFCPDHTLCTHTHMHLCPQDVSVPSGISMQHERDN